MKGKMIHTLTVQVQMTGLKTENALEARALLALQAETRQTRASQYLGSPSKLSKHPNELFARANTQEAAKD